MNPQEQNKPKAPFQGPNTGTPNNQKNDAYKKPSDMQDKNRKPEDKESDGSCSTTKGSCGTK